jgi:hypothetical protein
MARIGLKWQIMSIATQIFPKREWMMRNVEVDIIETYERNIDGSSGQDIVWYLLPNLLKIVYFFAKIFIFCLF